MENNTATIKNDFVLENGSEQAQEPTPFLSINDESISLEKAIFYYLRRNSGLWLRVIDEIKRQYALEKELEQKPEVRATKRTVNRTIGDIQIQTNMLNPNLFNKWLQNQYISYDDFYSQIALSIEIDRFKTQIVQDEEKLKQYFEARKYDLAGIVLSRIVVETKEEGENIKQQLDAEPGRFEQLAQEKSIADDKVMGGWMGVIRRSRLPKHIQDAIKEACSSQKIIGPILSEDRYAILRVDKVLEASLDNESLKQELRNEMFENWLRDKLKTINVSMA
ncbi:MAG: hypothetical protein F6J93_25565 [Oscillatoria sp. SIO1A7]|nr:hypothetical protein [Oscillatoria sp. SIO1A7]